MRAGQADRELSEFAQGTVDLDRAAMLLRDDVIADRETETGALAGRLGGEERLEQFVPNLGSDTGAVVPHPDLDHLAEITCAHREHRAEIPIPIPGLAPALCGGIEAVAEEVEKDAGHVLRYHFDRHDAVIQVTLEQDIEILVLGTRAVIGEV